MVQVLDEGLHPFGKTDPDRLGKVALLAPEPLSPFMWRLPLQANKDAPVGDCVREVADPGERLRSEHLECGELEATALWHAPVDLACVASATVEALDEERLSEIVAALDGPSAAVLPAGIVSDLERDRIVDAAAGCLPWTQTILDSLQDLPDVPPAVVECAQAAAPSVETDRLAADIALFGGELVTVLNLVLPPDCLPQTGGSQADTPAGRVTATQLMLAGISPESAACVAEQVDALGGMPSGESDTDSAMAAEQATAMMLGCLTPEEMALLSGPGSS